MIAIDDTCTCYLCDNIVSRYTQQRLPVAQEDPENRDSVITVPVCDECFEREVNHE